MKGLEAGRKVSRKKRQREVVGPRDDNAGRVGSKWQTRSEGVPFRMLDERRRSGRRWP